MNMFYCDIDCIDKKIRRLIAQRVKNGDYTDFIEMENNIQMPGDSDRNIMWTPSRRHICTGEYRLKEIPQKDGSVKIRYYAGKKYIGYVLEKDGKVDVKPKNKKRGKDIMIASAQAELWYIYNVINDTFDNRELDSK